MSYKFRTELDVNKERTQAVRLKFWLLITNYQEWRIFGMGFRRASCFGADQFLAILCRAHSPDATKDLRKVLLGLEAADKSHIQYSHIASSQHRSSTLKPLAQNKLMRRLAR